MDWKLFGSALGLVFLAELGDKTQLATLTLAASGSRLPVFLGSATALVLSSAIASLAGEAVARVIPAIWLQRAAGIAFVILGLVYLRRSW